MAPEEQGQTPDGIEGSEGCQNLKGCQGIPYSIKVQKRAYGYVANDWIVILDDVKSADKAAKCWLRYQKICFEEVSREEKGATRD